MQHEERALRMSHNVKTPIFDMLERYKKEKCIRFHMPGHKGLCPGSPMEKWADAFAYDVTEVPGTDNLHAPKEAILEAEQLLAKAYGAEKSFLLVNGSTCGVLAAISAAFSAGDKVLVDASCHRCVWNGLQLVGAEGIAVEDLSATAIRAAAEKEPDCKGVILTRPDYYGICKDVQGIFQVCEENGLWLITDEAHGAHLAFGEASGYPVSAVRFSHFTVQSAHKMLGSLNQTAYLHLYGKGATYAATVRKWLGVFQTSSPSYLLLASADCARAYMEQQGAEGLETLRQYVERATVQIQEKTKFRVEQGHDLPEGYSKTPDRLIVDTQVGGISGYDAEAFLRTQKVQVEMSDERGIVCLCTVFDTWEDFEGLIQSLVALQKAAADGTLQSAGDLEQRKEILKQFREKIGQPLQQDITPYPPGIPLARCGDVLTATIYDEAAKLYLAGGNILGLAAEESN